MKAHLLLTVVLMLPVLSWAAEAPKPPVDIFKPDWLAGHLPPALLVYKFPGTENEPVKKKFLDALERVRQARPVKLDDFPAKQTPPERTNRSPIRGPSQKSADAGFLVLLSQTGKVVALYVAYTTDADWAQVSAMNIADWTFEPARYQGRAVPVLLCVRSSIEHSISFH